MKQLIYCLIALLVMGCKEKYDSPIKSPVTGYLVIDGVVNSGSGPASLRLSRTTKFDNKDTVYEKAAQVNVQGEDSSVHLLVENANGVYASPNLNLSSSLKYRLRITTADGKHYVSDFVAVRNNPPIDSISWKIENNGLQFYINTHDPQNNTRYYQWYYDETWEIHSSFYSSLRYKIIRAPDGIMYTVEYRDSTTFSFDPDIITCWQFNKPLNIFLSSTAKLSQDIVAQPVSFIPHGAIQLGVLYSMHVTQYSWTKEGYEFMEKMKKNTESTGSIFDAQPSELKGNIYNAADATEPVIGFFNLSPIQERRIFIKSTDVPGWGYATGCIDKEIENISDSIEKKGLGLLPTEVAKRTPTGGIATFKAAPPECVDCTLRGTNKKPAYWP